ncbi:hypothetical protein, partial [Tsukamurella sputi]
GTSYPEDLMKRYIEGRRKVDSGSFPLYSLCVAFGTLASIIQLAAGAPESIVVTTSGWFAWAFIGLQLIGSASILAALYVTRLDLDDSLKLEQVGALSLLAACATYVAAVATNNGGPPTTFATWLVVAFGTYLGFRAVEIRSILRELLSQEDQADGDT